MSYINKSISIYGTEKDFIKAVVDELTSADSRIVCETDIDAEFANDDTSHKVKVVFNVNGCYKLRFAREVKSQSVNYWYMEQVVNDTITNGAKVYYTGYNPPYSIDYVATRTWKMIFVSNDNAIAMIFGSYNSDMKNSYSYNVFSYHENGFNVVSLIPNEPAASKPALSAELLRTDESNKNEVYKISVNRLNYSRGDDVEIIESKVLFKSDIAEHDMKNVCDCSNVVAKNILMIDSVRYFAFDTNTLIKVKERLH